MTIRWKVNLAVIGLVALSLTAAGFSLWAVTTSAAHARAYARTRELSQFTADVRTLIYAQTANAQTVGGTAAPTRDSGWARTALDDVNVQVRLAATDRERGLWSRVRDGIVNLNQALTGHGSGGSVIEVRSALERDLRDLRHHYDVSEYDSMAAVAQTGFRAQVAIAVAGVLTVLLFVLYLIMIRAWLMRPVGVLRESAEIIGRGKLDHRVPLRGSDELARLARHIDAMAEGLARHQTALLEARELSAIGELCAHVAHGLRNPLAAIRTSVQLAERNAPGSQASRSVLGDIAQQADCMDRRITRLFEFGKPLQLRCTPVSFGTLAAAVHAQVRSLLASRGVTMGVEDRTEGRAWPVDRDRLADALAELVSNAVHHSSKAGEVILRAESLPPTNGTRHCLRIEVVDAGAGMSEATLAKARDLFFSTRADGTGMGLALVQRIINEHGGDLTIASAPGKGTTVSIALPDVSPTDRSSSPLADPR